MQISARDAVEGITNKTSLFLQADLKKNSQYSIINYSNLNLCCSRLFERGGPAGIGFRLLFLLGLPSPASACIFSVLPAPRTLCFNHADGLGIDSMLPKESDDIFQVQLFCFLFTGDNLPVVSRAEVFIFPDHMVDGYEHFSCNGNDSLFVAAALFQVQIFVIEIGLFLRALDRGQCTLDQQGFQVMAAFADPCGLFPAGALVVCRGEAGPGGQGTTIPPDGHISAGLTKDIQGGLCGHTGYSSQMGDGTAVSAAEKGEFVIDHCDASVDIVQMSLDDP